MSKRSRRTTEKLKRVRRVRDITEYRVSRNGLRVLFARRRGTGVVTTNIVYFVGSRDEARGETGLAHMLEHMLFKPTVHDRKRREGSASMQFERQCGVVLNANTWKDRTTYYFSYPKEHLHRALQIEAERMRDVIISDKEFTPERTNVLSEYDMYAGDEHFALAVEMASSAFQAHPYGHETIGFREDIEGYTREMLERFYKKFYTPENAVLIVVGDITESEMRAAVSEHFGAVTGEGGQPTRALIREPKQGGLRTVELRRPSETSIYAIGVKHSGFPSREWFLTAAVFDMLAGGKDSILHRALVDTGLATGVETTLEPTREVNLGILSVTLGTRVSHDRVAEKVEEVLASLTTKTAAPYVKKTIAKAITGEHTSRENSLGYVAELTEYVSVGTWETFFDTEKILRSITPTEVLAHLHMLFQQENRTVGRFIGTAAS